MSLFFAVALVAVTLTLVAYPLFVPGGRRRPERAGDSRMHELLNLKETILSAISELDFDYNLGNLAEEDYRELRRRYEHRAVTVLKSIDELKQSLDEEIEKEVRAIREAKPTIHRKRRGTG
ncbi:MAG: hypothetical protein HYX82_04365 [Chloroflexi bacterium]|nr:hypothetical protein [Chloroflexota bacterium]